MEADPYRPTRSQIEFVRQQLGTSEEALKSDVTALREWLRDQPHLPTDGMDDDRLERLHIIYKCKIERTKKALDAYFSLKNVFPELLLNRDPLDSNIRQSTETVMFYGIPQLTPDGFRVTTIVFMPPTKEIDVAAICKHVIIATETMLALDYALGNILIVDLKHLAMSHILAFGSSLARKTVSIYTTIYNRSVKRIHLVNAPALVDKLVAVVKVLMPAKLVKRILIHRAGKDTLLDHVPREFVPNELGGSAGTSEELFELSLATMAGIREWLVRQDEMVSDESRRPRRQPGFSLLRKLDVD
ncbi:clavesin-2-like [Schistocerca cancellata]|uniref:clavesin-2-like n=1 Tax=Schistocerca cancellata TaxID=274614 RepID=UPI0021190866|nr:clavesin-2-like [Schistocerca cancellata]